MTAHTDAELARALAAQTGELLTALRRDPPVGRSLRDAGDAAAHELIVRGLGQARPDDVVFSEEAADPRRRLAQRRVWIVDPLDGTREYGEPGREDWAVHIALWADGALVAGAVALPALGEVYATDDPPSRPRPPAHPAHPTTPTPTHPTHPTHPGPRIVVSRSRPPAVAGVLASELGGELLTLGSAGAKAAAVWRGRADAYVHTGGLHEWDAAAPVAVAAAAGLHTSRLDGAPLVFNQSEPYVPDLLICVPELADAILARTTPHTSEVTRR